jgi:hypothetical protein
MSALFKAGNYNQLVVKNINETYDVVRSLRHEAYKTSKNERYLISSNDSDPPLEEVLNLVLQIPKKKKIQLQKNLKPKRLYKVLKREPVAKELLLPKKASQLMSILLEKEPIEKEYKKVLTELNVMLGKSNERIKGVLSNRTSDAKKLNSMLKVSYGVM